MFVKMAILWSSNIFIVAVVFGCLCDTQTWRPSSQKPLGQALQQPQQARQPAPASGKQLEPAMAA